MRSFYLWQKLKLRYPKWSCWKWKVISKSQVKIIRMICSKHVEPNLLVWPHETIGLVASKFDSRIPAMYIFFPAMFCCAAKMWTGSVKIYRDLCKSKWIHVEKLIPLNAKIIPRDKYKDVAQCNRFVDVEEKSIDLNRQRECARM